MLGFGPEGWGGVLLLAALMTVALTLAALAVGAVFGALVAAAKLSRFRTLRVIGDVYTTVFRGVPELLVIYLFYFGGSTLVTTVGQWFGAEGFVGVPPFVIGALAVGMIPARIRPRCIARRCWRCRKANSKRPVRSACRP